MNVICKNLQSSNSEIFWEKYHKRFEMKTVNKATKLFVEYVIKFTSILKPKSVRIDPKVKEITTPHQKVIDFWKSKA